MKTASSKKTTSGSVTFTKAMNSDLFYAIHKVKISTKTDKIGKLDALSYVTISDVFDFAYDNKYYDSLFTSLINNWAWLCQQTGVLNQIDVKTTFMN